MGYSKPTGQIQKSYKYRCMVTGDSRMMPCGGCTNTQGCLSNSMQYKETENG